MRLKTRRESCALGTEFTLYPLGDIHLGSANCDKGALFRVIDTIRADPHARWLGIGDYCMPVSTKALTERGFVSWDEVQRGDRALAFDGSSLVWSPVIGTYVSPSQEILELSSKSFSARCTSGHSWIATRSSPRTEREASPRKVATNLLNKSHRITTSAACSEDGWITLSDDDAALIGWVVTDGHIRKAGSPLTVSVLQSKEPYRTDIRESLSRYFTAEYLRDGISCFNVSTPHFKELCASIGSDPYRLKEQLPEIVVGLSPSARQSMMDAMLHAEGWTENGLWRFSQLPGPVLEAFKILATMAGFRIGLGKVNQSGVVTIPLMASRPNVTVADLDITPTGELEPVWCPQTEAGTWVCQQGNQISITGNCEYITPKDKRWYAGGIDEAIINLANLDRIGDAYVEKISDILRPIMDKCWGMGKGNHEGTFEREHHTNLTQRILQACGAPGDLYTGWACITRIVFEDPASHRSSVRIFHSHGWQAGRLSGAKVNQLDHLMGWIDGCRIYLQGHSHDRVVKTKTKLDTNPSFTKLTAYDSFGAHTGSYLRTYQQDTSAYGEEHGYPPVPIGPPTFTLTPTRGGVHVRSIQGDR